GPANHSQLWRSDGTPEGTFQLTSVDQGIQSASSDQLLMSPDGQSAYFFARTTAAGTELWRTDGTAAGTAMVIDLYPGGNNGTLARSMAIAGGSVVFSGSTPANGTELFVKSGSGAQIVTDLVPGAGRFGPNPPTSVRLA